MKIRNVLLGTLLIGVGLVLFARNFGWIDFSFDLVAPYWPLLWILAGFMVWMDPQKRVLSGTTVSLLLISIPLMIYSNSRKWQSNFNWSEDNEEEYTTEMESNREYGQQSFQLDLPDTLTSASFSMTSGLGQYSIKESQQDLFWAKLKGRHRQMKLTEGYENGVYSIDLSEPSGKKQNFKGESDIILGFHRQPLWDMKWEIGLGDVDLDLRDLKVRSLELSAGLAEMKVKIGTEQTNTRIKLKSGMADTEIEIPGSAGGEIRTESALSSFDFEGFDKIEPGLYRTSNFKESPQKVIIDIESGFAAVQVKRK